LGDRVQQQRPRRIEVIAPSQRRPRRVLSDAEPLCRLTGQLAYGVEVLVDV
jgi:hypothetical protein